MIFIILFIIVNNVSYNLINIITSNFVFRWTFDIFKTIGNIKDVHFLCGNLLILFLFILVIVKYDKSFNLKLNRSDNLPIEDGAYEYGSARWCKGKELKKHFDVWNINSNLPSGGVPVTYYGGKHYYDSSSAHTLIIGSTGSGKSVSFIIPLIFNLASAGESMVINDTKGELYSYTADYLKERGYEIKIINLRDALASDGWNPLHLPYKYYKEGNIDEAGDLIENFASSLTQNLSSKDMYWEKSSNAVLVALCYAIIEDAERESQVNLYSIYNLLVEHGAKNIGRENSLNKYFDDRPFGNIAKNSYATGSFAKGETRATLFSVLATVIKMFSDIGIANLTSRTDFELDNIGKKKTAIFLIIPDEKKSRHGLASLFIDQCYQALVNTAQSYGDGKMPIRTNFILDEFANMPPISSISNKVTVSRSRNIRFYFVIQDFSQLKETYKEEAGTIKSNCNNWVYLLTADNDTAKEISARLGKYTISTSRISTSSRLEQSDFNISNDKSLLGRELLTPDELMRFKFGESIFLKTRMFPIRAVSPPIQDYGFKIKKSSLPTEHKEYKIDVFNLDEYRTRQIKNEIDDLVDLE